MARELQKKEKVQKKIKHDLKKEKVFFWHVQSIIFMKRTHQLSLLSPIKVIANTIIACIL